jgi:predicted DNA-binding protein (UPF0251 family)
MRTSVVSLDQFEAMRLCDSEGLDQEEAGRRMRISRGTIQRLLYSGRRAIIDGMLQNDAIVINLKESEEGYAGLHTNERKCRTRGYHM